MIKKLFFLLLLLPSSPLLAQPALTKAVKRPPVAGAWFLSLDNNSNLLITPKTGPGSLVPVNLSQILGLGATLDNKPTLATVSTIRSWTGTLPNSFMLADAKAAGYFTRDDAATAPDDSSMTLVTNGVRYRRVWNNQQLDVRWFPGGSYNGYYNETTGKGDEQPINRAIAYARTLSETNGGAYRPTVVLPAGQLMIRKTINATGLNGITLRGAGRYINTVITGCTSNPDGSGAGIMVDFSNSSQVLLENVSLSASTAWGLTCSKVAVQFALGQNTANGQQQNGLNNAIRNVFIGAENADLPSANGGLGFIGILNCKSEEFSAESVNIKANTPMVFTNAPSLGDAGYSYTVTSPYTTVMPGYGSMGVINIGGQTSLFNVQARSPGVILNGVNTFNFVGYLSHYAYDIGSNEVAFAVTQACFGLKIHATVETFGTLLSSNNLLVNPDVNITTSYQKALGGNAVQPTVPVFDLTGAQVKGGRLGVAFGNPLIDTYGSRLLIYHAPMNGGNDPVADLTSIQNCIIDAPQWPNNRTAITGNLYKKTSNTSFNTGQPFHKQGGWSRFSFEYPIPCGTVASLHPTTIARFATADPPAYTSNNAGVYRIEGSGTIHAGGINAVNTAVRGFHFTGSVSQNGNGARGTPVVVVILEEQQANNPDYLTITGVSVTLDFYVEGGLGHGRINVTPTVSGSDTSAPVTATCASSVLSIFNVNGSTIYL